MINKFSKDMLDLDDEAKILKEWGKIAAAVSDVKTNKNFSKYEACLSAFQ